MVVNGDGQKGGAELVSATQWATQRLIVVRQPWTWQGSAVECSDMLASRSAARCCTPGRPSCHPSSPFSSGVNTVRLPRANSAMQAGCLLVGSSARRCGWLETRTASERVERHFRQRALSRAHAVVTFAKQATPEYRDRPGPPSLYPCHGSVPRTGTLQLSSGPPYRQSLIAHPCHRHRALECSRLGDGLRHLSVPAPGSRCDLSYHLCDHLTPPGQLN